MNKTVLWSNEVLFWNNIIKVIHVCVNYSVFSFNFVLNFLAVTTIVRYKCILHTQLFLNESSLTFRDISMIKIKQYNKVA